MAHSQGIMVRFVSITKKTTRR